MSKSTTRSVAVPYKQIFAHMKYFAEISGYRVRMCNLHKSKDDRENADGDMSPFLRDIRIHKSLTWHRKVLVLAHEFFGHACQYGEAMQHLKEYSKNNKGVKGARTKYRKSKEFTESDFGKYLNYLAGSANSLADNKESMNLIEFCEVDASTRGAQILREVYLVPEKAIDYQELMIDNDPETARFLREGWRLSYCDIAEDTKIN